MPEQTTVLVDGLPAAVPAGRTVSVAADFAGVASSSRNRASRITPSRSVREILPSGRIYGPATRFFYGRQPDFVRPPIFPARLRSLGKPTGEIA